MKNNNYRLNRLLRQLLEKKDDASEKNRINLKDLIIPIMSALLAVGLNQLFFEANKRTEYRIQIRKDILIAQRPVLNRILSFTYRYQIVSLRYLTIRGTRCIYTDAKTGKKVKETFVEDKNKTDTTIVNYPAFAYDSLKKQNFMSDLETIRQQRDLLDVEVYVSFDALVLFLEKNPFPNSEKELLSSSWTKKETIKKWDELVDTLRKTCYNKLYEFESSSYEMLNFLSLVN